MLMLVRSIHFVFHQSKIEVCKTCVEREGWMMGEGMDRIVSSSSTIEEMNGIFQLFLWEEKAKKNLNTKKRTNTQMKGSRESM